MGGIAYSGRKVDLFYPARAEGFFPGGLPVTEALLCAEMVRLAYCRPEPYFQLDQSKIRRVLEPLGFVCEFFETKGAPEGRGTHGFLASHSEADPNKAFSVIAFRGTDAADPTDIADDAEFLQTTWPQGGRVHRGFAEALDPILPDLDRALARLRGRILFAGHSLGAAMATLLASIKRPHFLYTFGSPRIGDQAFVNILNGLNTRRFVNCCDIVARIPPESLGEFRYAHCGVPHYIDRTGQIIENPAPEFADRDRVIAASEYLVKYAWRNGNLAVRELADHSPINYASAIAADASQTKLNTWSLAVKGATSN